jgi:predicted porin
MQKKIIALAIAAAISAPAFADTSNVTVYGVANVSYDMTKTGTVAAANSFSSNKVSSNTSRLGVKGSEDLGDGLSAIWQIESLINIDNAGQGAPGATGTTTGATLGGRNTFAGLSSATAGTVLLGRHDTPYNIATRKLDVFGDGIADNRSIMGGGIALTTVGASFDGRQPNVVAYISPAMSGFTGAVAYVAGAEGQQTAAQTKGSAWSMAGLYSMDAFYASLAYEVHNIGNAPGTLGPVATLGNVTVKESATKLGLGYTIDAFSVGFAYEKTSDNFGGNVALAPAAVAGSNVLGHNAYYLSGKYNLSANDAIKLAYTKAGSNVTANTGAKQFSLGYDHSLSKRTTVYAMYTKLSNETGGVYALSANGTGAPAVAAAGAAPSAFSFGMKHSF